VSTTSTHPADVIAAMVEHVLDLAATWPQWDGTPFEAPVEGEPQPRLYTPHKAVRRVCDHLIDHLAEIDARLAGRPTEPDTWHGSMVTTPADMAPFTADDVDEAGNRLRRLASMYDVRLRPLTAEQLDARDGDAWPLREVALHVAESAFYADAVGRLTA
jgi:hypothetical protein